MLIEKGTEWPICWVIDVDFKAAGINIFKDKKEKVDIISEPM